MLIIIAVFIVGFMMGGLSSVILSGDGSRMAAIANGDYLGFPRSYPGPTEPTESQSTPTTDKEIKC